MTENLAKTDLVVITAKRLDSDEVAETIVEVEAPTTEIGMREQLAALVRPLYPGAEFRSFANGAATYLAPKLLVVAVYRLSGEPNVVAANGNGDNSQQQLFAA